MDVAGLVVCPGLIDLHVHLREPGQSAKETIATGTAAAARGGFTSLVCMPNTSPAIDNSGTVALIHERAAQQGVVNVYVTGAITKNIAGEELAPIGSLNGAGVVAITDDGHCVQNNELMRRALEYAEHVRSAGDGSLPGLFAGDRRGDARRLLEHGAGFAWLAGGGRGDDGGAQHPVGEVTGARVHCQHLSAAAALSCCARPRSAACPFPARLARIILH